MLIELLKAAFIGIVEGLTEWLPISSTGHMILVDEFIHLAVSDEFLEMFLVVIQIGAICAVLTLYFSRLNPFSHTKSADERLLTWKLWGMIAIGCIPAAVIGLLFDDWVNEHFYNYVVVASMLILYGVIFIVMERRNARIGKGAHARAIFKINSVDEIDWRSALKIGFFQVLAIIPGTSRSGATIIGGMLCGLARATAAEFTFFLAIPVMFGWGLVRVVRFVVDGIIMTSTEILVLIVGLACAFITSVLSIRFLMRYIKQNDFIAFGVYRIAIGAVVLCFFFAETFL